VRALSRLSSGQLQGLFSVRVVQDSHPSNRTHSHESTYAQATSSQNVNHPSPPTAPDTNNSMSNFLQEFKALINPLIALLAKVITCLLDKKNDLQHSHNQSLTILLFNANGLKNHVNELQFVLHNKHIDLALITKTHFTQHLYIYIPGYKLVRANHPDNTAHGVIAILIKSIRIFQTLLNYCYDHLQSCSVLIYLNSIPVSIAALYSPPKHKVLNVDFHNYFSSFGNNFILGGDYNAIRVGVVAQIIIWLRSSYLCKCEKP